VLLAIAGAAGVAAGHPETLLHVAIFAVVALWPLLHIARANVEPGERARPRAGPRLRWTFACALLATSLAAPALFPFLDNLRMSTEWLDRRPHGRTHVEIPLKDTLERLRPAGALLALGTPLDGSWRGPENLAELGGAATGGAALFLAVFALTSAPRAERRAIWTIAAIGVLGLLVGAHMRIVSAPFGWLPLLGDSLLKRLSLWWVLAVVLLAAAGTEALVDAGRRSGRFLVATASAAIVSALAVAQAFATSPPATHARLWQLEILPIVAAIGAVMLFRYARPLVAVVALLASLVVPRVALFDGWIPKAPPEAFYLGTRAHAYLLDRLAHLPSHGYRVTGLEAALPPHSGAFHSLQDIRTYDPMAFSAYERFISAVGAPSRDTWSRVLLPYLPALTFLGARFVIEDPPPPVPADRGEAANFLGGLNQRRQDFRDRGLALAYEDADAVIWERRDALPRVFFPRTSLVAAGRDALDQAASIDDYEVTAIVDRPISPDAPIASSATGNGARVLSLDVAPGVISAEVDSDFPRLLATSQPAIPGWRLAIDGERAPDRMRIVNTAFLGVAVPPGRHHIELTYAPLSWRLGLALASAGALATAFLLVPRRARRLTW
jgi:hypothetical protein